MLYVECLIACLALWLGVFFSVMCLDSNSALFRFFVYQVALVFQFIFCFFVFFFKQKTAYELYYGLVGSEMYIRDRKSRYQDGERHGLELWYHENGQIWRKRPYRYGKKHGLHEWYFKGNQILSRKTWKNGKRHGLHEKFDRTGYLISSKIYKDGKLVVSLFDMSQTE